MTKSKFLFIFASLALIFAAIVTYLGQGSSRLRSNDSDSALKASLSGYELFRYKGDELRERISGRRAALMEPSQLICQDDILGFRIKNGIREQASSKKATVVFAGESLFNQKDSMIDTVELDGDVEFQRSGSQFQTERLLYSDKTGEATTDSPVRMESAGQFVAAEGGMIYNMRNEAVKLRGGVVGSIRTDVMRGRTERNRSK